MKFWLSTRTWWICLVLAGVTVAVFSPLFHYSFLTFDDQLYVTENPWVRSGLRGGLAWAFTTTTSGNWLPLTWLSHMLDWQIYGARAGGHHAGNVLLHTANVLLLFLLLRKMTGAFWRSTLVAALFAWHPAHVESVAWVSERKDVLSTFFGLLTVWAYLFYARPPRQRPMTRMAAYVGAGFFYALSVLAKPMLVTLPFLLLLIDFWPLERLSRQNCLKRVWEKIPLFILSAACCCWTVWAQRRGHAVASAVELTVPHRLEHALAAYLQYIRLLAWPRRLAIFYPYPRHEFVGWVIGGGAALLLMIFLVITQARRRPWISVGLLWFIGMMVPVIGVVQVGGQSLADRYTYMSSVGIFIVVAWCGAELAARVSVVRWLGPIALVCLLGVTWKQVHYWRNTRTVFEHALAVTRDNYLALTLLGSLDADEGNNAAALVNYKEALRINPSYPEAHFFLGRDWEKQGRLDEAETEYTRAVRLKPEFQQARIFLGLLEAKEGNYPAATAQYEAVLAINPLSAPAQNDLGRVLQSEGRMEESRQHYQAAVQDDPSLAEARNNLGVAYLQESQITNGIQQLREALKLKPDDHETEYNLALALNQAGQWPEALTRWTPLARSQPNNAQAQYELGRALQHEDRVPDAMGQFARSILINPDYSEALDALAWIASTAPQPERRDGGEALEMARHACALTKNQRAEMLLTLAAAEAETGHFTDAIPPAVEARALAKKNRQPALEKLGHQLETTFRAGQPFRTTQAKE